MMHTFLKKNTAAREKLVNMNIITATTNIVITDLNIMTTITTTINITSIVNTTSTCYIYLDPE